MFVWNIFLRYELNNYNVTDRQLILFSLSTLEKKTSETLKIQWRFYGFFHSICFDFIYPFSLLRTIAIVIIVVKTVNWYFLEWEEQRIPFRVEKNELYPEYYNCYQTSHANGHVQYWTFMYPFTKAFFSSSVTIPVEAYFHNFKFAIHSVK